MAELETKMQEALSSRPGFRGDGASDFGGFSDYLKENVSKEEINEGLNFAGEWMVPFYDAGSKVYNVVEEYSKPEDERDYDFIKEELNKAGTSAGTEAAMWLMGGVATKYGAKGVKALSNKAKQYEIDPSSMSAFGVGAVKKKADEVELPPAENAARTQIAGTLPTYKKADTLLTELAGEGKTLDFGAGLGLSKKELGFDTYEPFPKGDFTPDFTSPDKIPSSSYKKITNLNVLNVVPREVRDGIVRDIGRILEPNGTAVITTRGRDVMAAKGKAGPEPMSIITSKDTYQKGFTQPELRDYISETLGDGFTIINNKLGAAGVTVQKLATKNFSEGGMAMDDQMQVMFKSNRTGYALGGEVEAIDPVSGNEVPPGSTPKEVRDDIPAMLSEGEYVVPADVTRYYGVKFFEDLRTNAKVNLEDMEDNGRIGGEPVSEDEGDLTEDEMALLSEVMNMNEPIGMAEGGMVGQQMAPTDPYQQQAMMYKEPIKAAAGISVQSGQKDAFGNPVGVAQTPPGRLGPSTTAAPITNQNIYGLNTAITDPPTTLLGSNSAPVVTAPETSSTPAATATPDVGGGMETLFYIHKDGRRISVLMLNGNPISSVPADFSEFVLDTPENRTLLGFGDTATETSTDTTGTATEGATVDVDADTKSDNDTTSTIKTVATPTSTSGSSASSEDITRSYTNSGVNLEDPLQGALDALEGGFKVPAGLAALGSAAGLGPLAIGAGLLSSSSQLNALSKAQANLQMAEFLGLDDSVTKGIQDGIDKYVAGSPKMVKALEDSIASGDKRFNDAVAAATNMNAGKEVPNIFYDNLSTKGKSNVNTYLTDNSPGYSGATIRDDGSITRENTAVTTSLRPVSRPTTRSTVSKDTPATENKGLYESITGKKFEDTNLGKALGLGTSNSTSTADSAIATKLASTNDITAEDVMAASIASAKAADTSNNNNSSSSNDSGGSGGGCCFIMLEARYGNGVMDKVVRQYRDEYMTDRNRRGYYKLAEVLVPLMRKSKVFKWVITKTFADPLVSYGKYYYGQNKSGALYTPVKSFWMKIFDVLGGDTEFIRENGEIV